MPVYNAEKYVGDAIDSILNQTFGDFEFIIIDDGSSDNSPNIIKKYSKKDPRIKIVTQSNKGVGASLISGVALAQGKYIARMDADDISLPARFKKQYEYLESNPHCAMISSVVQPIDEAGRFLEFWLPDKETISSEQIEKLLPIENCIAHPSIMIRAQIMKRFNYIEARVPSEDYDLWLRLIAAGYKIHKIDEPLLLYRVHDASITQSYNKSFSINRKILKVKLQFLIGQFTHARFGPVERRVLASFIRLFIYLLSRKVENFLWKIFIAPLKPYTPVLKRINTKISRILYLSSLAANRILLYRKLIGGRNHNKKSVLFIVPWFGFGGAEKVVLDIITGLDKKGIEVFCISTVISNNAWMNLYAKYCTKIIDLDSIAMESNKAWFINKFVKFNHIERVITTNNYAGYRAAELIRRFSQRTKVFDIVHGQGGKKENGGWPLFSVPYDKYINKRIVVTEYLKRYIIKKYRIPADKITVIHNGIAPFEGPIPDDEIKKKGKFIVLWAGRLSYEKHPELVVRTAEVVSKKNKNIHFVIVGDGEMKPELKSMIVELSLEDFVTIADKPYSDPRSYMCYADVLMMSSEMEGLPVVILEAMMSKLPVIAPKVGGIPEEVHDGNNGYLIPYSFDFPRMAAEKIMYLSKNIDTAKEMGENGYRLAQTEFSMSKMIDEYIKILEI